MYTSNEALRWEGESDMVDSIDVRIRLPPGWSAQSRSVGLMGVFESVDRVEGGIEEIKEL